MQRDLPYSPGEPFTVAEARRRGIGRGRLRGEHLERPFHGVRRLPSAENADADDFWRAREQQRALAAAYRLRMPGSQFFSHETATHIWGAPLPVVSVDPIIDVAVLAPAHAPRGRGVHGRQLSSAGCILGDYEGYRVTTPACTWAMLGHLDVVDLVAVGDYFCRVWRDGVGRPRPQRGLATRAELESAMTMTRRAGAGRLRSALALIREDSWSPNESRTRCVLVAAGLPEPELNRDVWERNGRFLGCLDMSYPNAKIAIEYMGQHHGKQYARDVERVERLRAAGWIVIQVSSTLLFGSPAKLVERVRAALIARGWRG